MPDEGDSRSRSQAEQASERAWLTVSVVHDDGVWPGFEATEALIVAAAAALAGHAKFRKSPAAEACIALSSDDAVRTLNATYRRQDKPTNVLSFPASASLPSESEGVRWLGDVVVAEDTIAREAVEQSVAPSHHLQHLVVHGLLHLLGCDHETDADAAVMEGLEIEVLAALGVSDPYVDAPQRTKEAATP